jgi:amino acid transporter
VLTVAVSISAGVAAITSAFPAVHDKAVPLAVGFAILIAVANLRGAKECGLLFAVPTYSFVASIALMLVAGYARLAMGHAMTPPQPPEAWANHAHAAGGVGLFLILRAFSSGSTALTGVEAVTDGVPAFQAPEAKNAARVMLWLGVILHNENGFLVKWALLFKKGVVVTNIRYHLDTTVDEDLGLHPLTSAIESALSTTPSGRSSSAEAVPPVAEEVGAGQ